MDHQELKEWRKSLALTQDQAAYLLGVKRAGYQYRERGAVPLSLETEYATAYLSEHPEIVAERLTHFTPSR